MSEHTRCNDLADDIVLRVFHWCATSTPLAQWAQVVDVSRKWRTLALGAPTLWTCLSFDHASLPIFRMALRRSGQQPIQLYLNTHDIPPIESAWAAVHIELLPHRQRIVVFGVCFSRLDLGRINTILQIPYPRLKRFKLELDHQTHEGHIAIVLSLFHARYPRLRQLWSRKVYVRQAGDVPTFGVANIHLHSDVQRRSNAASWHFVYMLKGCPNVQELFLGNSIPSEPYFWPNGVSQRLVLSLPRLRRLSLVDEPRAIQTLLSHLDLHVFSRRPFSTFHITLDLRDDKDGDLCYDTEDLLRLPGTDGISSLVARASCVSLVIRAKDRIASLQGYFDTESMSVHRWTIDLANFAATRIPWLAASVLYVLTRLDNFALYPSNALRRIDIHDSDIALAHTDWIGFLRELPDTIHELSFGGDAIVDDVTNALSAHPNTELDPLCLWVSSITLCCTDHYAARAHASIGQLIDRLAMEDSLKIDTVVLRLPNTSLGALGAEAWAFPPDGHVLKVANPDTGRGTMVVQRASCVCRLPRVGC